jgi:hypothetical protein
MKLITGAHTTPIASPHRQLHCILYIRQTLKNKLSKAMDMIYHWLTERIRQKQFDVYWRP